jgi:hypothetical protein
LQISVLQNPGRLDDWTTGRLDDWTTGRLEDGIFPLVSKRIFSYEDAVALLPEVQRLTHEAFEQVDELSSEEPDQYERIVTEWAESVIGLGIEVKGLWLVDFDSGAGYYCWHYPEPALEYFHGYDEGFPGRVKLN